MTATEVLGVIWVTTMVLLGLAWQRASYWKDRHDFDHRLADRLHRIMLSMEPTQSTFELVERLNKEEDMQVVLTKDNL